MCLCKIAGKSNAHLGMKYMSAGELLLRIQSEEKSPAYTEQEKESKQRRIRRLKQMRKKKMALVFPRGSL
jgi:hypothetical protein